jgi:TolB-like protein/DNA-binding winged helix-turn-helix (wHTH) protein/Tfp pilus assembly protein PilF
MASKVCGKYALGEDFELEPDKRRLSTQTGTSVHLANRPFQVLLYLIDNRDRVVGRQELLDRYWDGRDVYDETLTKCVGAIRKALDDQQKDQPRFIETRWAEGYRFIGPIREVLNGHSGEVAGNGHSTHALELLPASESPVPASRDDVRRRPGRTALFALVLAALVLAGAASMLVDNRRRVAGETRRPVRSIAVLPLTNLSEDPANDYFSDGLTESLINALSRIEGLKVVIARSSAPQVKGRDLDPKEVGKQLGVASVLEGSVRKSKDSVRVALRMISVEDGTVLWAGDSNERALKDLFALQDEIAHNMVSALRVQLSTEGDRALAHRYTKDVEAYQLYLKGRYFWNKRTEEGLRKSIEYFEQARSRDEHFALAYAGLADAYVHLNLYSATEQKDAFPKAKQAAERALQIDESLAEAHTTLGYIREQYEWDWAGAEAEFKRAIELNPNYATAHQYYSEYLALVNRTQESIAQIERAHELDPYSLIIVTELSYPYQWARQWDKALTQLDKALEMDPDFTLAVFYAARCHLQQGNYDEAISLSRKAVNLSGGSPLTVAGLGYAYAVAGKQTQARDLLRELTKQREQLYVSPYLIATIHIGLGEDDQALSWLERAYQEHDWLLVILKVDPRFDRVRKGPRFQNLLAKVGFAVS